MLLRGFAGCVCVYVGFAFLRRFARQLDLFVFICNLDILGVDAAAGDAVLAVVVAAVACFGGEAVLHLSRPAAVDIAAAAQPEAFAFVMAVVLDVAVGECACCDAIFAFVFCALGAGDESVFEVGVSFDVDLIAVIACVNTALFGNNSISLLLLFVFLLCSLLSPTYFR